MLLLLLVLWFGWWAIYDAKSMNWPPTVKIKYSSVIQLLISVPSDIKMYSCARVHSKWCSQYLHAGSLSSDVRHFATTISVSMYTNLLLEQLLLRSGLKFPHCLSLCLGLQVKETRGKRCCGKKLKTCFLFAICHSTSVTKTCVFLILHAKSLTHLLCSWHFTFFYVVRREPQRQQ